MRGGSEVFWGVLLVAAGLLMLLKYSFNLNIPIARTLAGLLLIYLGVSVLVGGGRWWGLESRDTLLFTSGVLEAGPLSRELNVIFSSGAVDLSGLSADRRDRVKVNVIFSHADLRLKAGQAACIKADAVLGRTLLPDGQTVSFGETIYQSPGEGEPVQIECHTVFGTLTVKD